MAENSIAQLDRRIAAAIERSGIASAEINAEIERIHRARAEAEREFAHRALPDLARRLELFIAASHQVSKALEKHIRKMDRVLEEHAKRRAE